jgi:hypothetical protein
MSLPLAFAAVEPEVVAAHIARYVENGDREPYSCSAAGLTASELAAAASEGSKP